LKHDDITFLSSCIQVLLQFNDDIWEGSSHLAFIFNCINSFLRCPDSPKNRPEQI